MRAAFVWALLALQPAAQPVPATVASSPAASPPAATPRVAPPRVDGTYLGSAVSAAAQWVRSPDLATDPLWGYAQALRVGDAVLPWMTIGIELALGRGFNSHQTSAFGGVMVELGFLPVPRRPLSLRVGYGIGGGSVAEQADLADASSFGGSLFRAGARYEFFPNAHKRRPTRGGGFVLGPELAWVGFTPAGRGQPMSHSLQLGLWFGVYFGS